MGHSVINGANLSSGLGFWKQYKHLPCSGQASPHSLLLPDPPASTWILCTSRVSVPSGRAKSTGPQQHSTDSAVTTGMLEASHGRWSTRALHTLTLAPPTPGFLSPGTGMREQLPVPDCIRGQTQESIRTMSIPQTLSPLLFHSCA